MSFCSVMVCAGLGTCPAALNCCKGGKMSRHLVLMRAGVGNEPLHPMLIYTSVRTLFLHSVLVGVLAGSPFLRVVLMRTVVGNLCAHQHEAER